jgi:hypothetical protein
MVVLWGKKGGRIVGKIYIRHIGKNSDGDEKFGYSYNNKEYDNYILVTLSRNYESNDPSAIHIHSSFAGVGQDKNVNAAVRERLSYLYRAKRKIEETFEIDFDIQ